MAVPETSAERVRRYHGKVTSSLQYVIAAAHSGRAYKTEVMEGSSNLLDTTQHFLNAITTLVVTSGGDVSELREQVTTRRHELCCELAELIRICDKMILADEVPSKEETTTFADPIMRLAGELMELITPVLERRVSSSVTLRTGSHLSPHRTVSTQVPRSKWASQGSLTMSKSVGLTTSGDLHSLPNDAYMRVESTDSGYSNGDQHPQRAVSSSVSAFATMPKSVSKKTRALFRKQSGSNLFEAKQETKAEVMVPGGVRPRGRLRSSSSTNIGPQPTPPQPVATRDNLAQGKSMSLSSPLLNQIKRPSEAADEVQRDAAHRTASHNVNSRGRDIDYSANTLPHPPRLRGISIPLEPHNPPLVPPKKRASTPGVSRNILTDVLAHATPPPRGPNQSTHMVFPPSPDVVRNSATKFFPSPGSSPRSNHSNMSGTITEVRIESPEGWSPSPSPVQSQTSSGSARAGSSQLSQSMPNNSFNSSSSVTPGGSSSFLSSNSVLSQCSPASTAGSSMSSTPRHSAVFSPVPSDPDGPPPKPYHPSMPSSRPVSAVSGHASPALVPDKPPHPTLQRNRSARPQAAAADERPPPMKPPRPPTLTFNPDNPPPIPPKKKAFINYLKQIDMDTYQSPTEQYMDVAPKKRIGSTPTSGSQAGSTPAVGEAGRSDSMGSESAFAASAAGNQYHKTPVSRTRSVLGSELNIPPPLPAKTKKGHGVKRANTIRSTGSGRHGHAIQEEPESAGSTAGPLAESPPHLPVGSGDSGVHTSSEQLSEDDRLSQTSSPEVSQDAEAPVNLLYFSDVDYYLVFNEETEGHSLLGGPVDALIAHAASDQKHESDQLYHEAFLLTYRTFVEPEVLIERLLERHDIFHEASNDVICRATMGLLLRVVDDIRGSMDQNITQRLLDTVFRLLCDNELKLGQILHRELLENLKTKGQPLRLARESLATARGPPPAEWNMARFRSRQVAVQLTLIDFAFYQAVEVHECLTWSMDQSEERCPTLSAFTEHFNNVSYWVRTRLLDCEKKSDRDKVMAKFIKVIEHLRELNNFNSMFALLAAMDCAAVNRMIWSKEATKSLEEPRKLIDNTNGFKNYREALVEAGSPCIPYLGLYLQDLTFINIGNSNMLDDNKDCVNFAKRWRQFKVMHKIKQCQQHGYESCKRDEDIIQYFNGFTSHLGEEELWERSMALKPRGQGPA